MSTPGRSPLVSRAHAISRACAAAAIALGLVVLVGWTLDLAALKSVLPSLNSMKANTALMFVLSGLAVYLAGVSAEGASRASRWLALGTGAIALATLAEYALGTSLGIDELAFSDPAGDPSGRPSPHTALAFLLIAGSAFGLDASGPRGLRLEVAVTTLAAAVVALSAIGYAFSVDYLLGPASTTGVALHTMLGLVVLTLGVLCARPRRAWFAVFVADGPGGVVARRLIPAVLAAPVLLGLERLLDASPLAASAAAFAAMVLVTAFAIWVAHRLEAADRRRRQLEDQLRDQAQRDPLTGVFNRRRLDQELTLLRGAGARNGLRTATLVIDVDGLKQTNDDHGHPAGDRVLVAVASALRSSVRRSDLIGRIGGDEFLVVMPESTPDAAETAAMRVLTVLRAVPLPDGVAPTVSIGVAMTAEGEIGEASVIHEADRAMYAAKADGGDAYHLAWRLEPARV